MFPFYMRSTQPEDIALRFLALIHTFALLIGFEERFHQNSMKMYPSTCSYFYSSDLLLCIINPQHGSLIESNTNKNMKLAMVQSLAQWKSKQRLPNFTSSQFYTSTTESTKPIDLPSFAPELLFLYCRAPSYFPSPLNVCNILGHPLLVVDMFHIMYKQTKFPTQTHKVSLKQSLQLLTNSDNIKSIICTKKVDSHSNQKPKP